jgi:hypothetical protein
MKAKSKLATLPTAVYFEGQLSDFDYDCFNF